MQELAKAAEEGRLVVLPCKVGDVVFYQTGRNTVGRAKRDFDRVEESIARGFCIDADGIQIRLDYNWKGNHGTYGVWGKTIFATREEAQAALPKSLT